MSIERIVKPVLQEPDMEKDCAFCNQPIIAQAAYCPLCNSQHHIECWLENEGCGKIGCYCNTSNQDNEKMPELSSTEDLVRGNDREDSAFDAGLAFASSLGLSIGFACGSPYFIVGGVLAVWMLKEKRK